MSKAAGDANAWIDAYVSKDGWFRLDQAQRRLEAWVANLDDEPDDRPLWPKAKRCNAHVLLHPQPTGEPD